jgi:hypothetical protein
MKYKVEFMDYRRGAVGSKVVEAENRGKAITKVIRQGRELDRGAILSAKSLNPLSGGGSKHG